MAVISSLQNMYGSELEKKKILLLNAGGQSQRLPNASILGKIFSPLPVKLTKIREEDDSASNNTHGDEKVSSITSQEAITSQDVSLMQQLDLKLASYIPLLSRMQPGFFHAAADTIEVYDIGSEDEEWNFIRPGFIALAHPSTPETGTGHGVFVLDQTKEDKKDSMVEFRSCLRVLQKPSIQQMRSAGAVCSTMESDGQSNGQETEFVYTDSAFFFDHHVANKLCDFYEENHPLDCEIDSYGDFLQGLGRKANASYTKDLKNVSKIEPKLEEIRMKIFKVLKGTPLNIVLLKASKFYHLGSMQEMLHHFCNDDVLAKEMGFEKHIMSAVLPSSANHAIKRSRQMGNMSGCLIQNCLIENSNIVQSSVVEYCNFAVPCHIGEACIVSNCEYVEGEISRIALVPKTFVHTVIIRESRISPQMYVTVFFSTTDNIKAKSTSETVEDLAFYGVKLGDISVSWNVGDNVKAIVFPHEQNLSLWNARLFPAKETMSKSFQCALKMQAALNSGNTVDLSGETLYSMVDLTQLKDVEGMLAYRQNLVKLIS